MKDARYFRHDSNARHDSKIKALIKKYGIEGYGRFWVIIETMREESGYKIIQKPYMIESLAEQMKCSCDEVKQFIKDCIEEYELFVQEDGFFYSPSLILRMSKLDMLRADRQRGAYAMHARLGHNITKEPYDENRD